MELRLYSVDTLVIDSMDKKEKIRLKLEFET